MANPQPLSAHAPGFLFRLAGIQHRTGRMIRVGPGSARVEYDALYRAVRRPDGRYKAVKYRDSQSVDIAPSSLVVPVEAPIGRLEDIPAINGVPTIRSSTDIEMLGWEFEGRPVLGIRTNVRPAGEGVAGEAEAEEELADDLVQGEDDDAPVEVYAHADLQEIVER